MALQKPRLTWLDGVLAVLLAAGAGWLVHRAAVNLEYRWNWSVIPRSLVFTDQDGAWRSGQLLQGLLITLRLSLWSGLLALVLGVGMGLARTGTSHFWRLASGAYVGLVRNLPPLVLVFVFYFFLGDQIMALAGLDDLALALDRSLDPGAKGVLEALFGPLQQVPAFFSAVLTLGLFEGAYITEIVRAGIESVERGQWEASAALGFTRRQQMRLVVLPQAFSRMLPALAGQFISTIKDSAIVSVISIQELTFAGQELVAATYRTFEVWITVLALYFTLCLSCSLLVRRLETRAGRGTRSSTL